MYVLSATEGGVVLGGGGGDGGVYQDLRVIVVFKDIDTLRLDCYSHFAIGTRLCWLAKAN